MDHILKTIETFEEKIAEHEREVLKPRSAVNQICAVAGMEPRYELDTADSSGTTAKSVGALKADEFYGKPLATAARQALTLLRNAGQAPAKAEAIFEILMQGGFDFPSKNQAHALTGLHVSLAKNTEVFVKLPNGLIGLREWYPSSPRARPRNGKDVVNETEPVPVEQADASPNHRDDQESEIMR